MRARRLAVDPVASYVDKWRAEFERHIDEGGCPFDEQSPIASLYHEPIVTPAAGVAP